MVIKYEKNILDKNVAKFTVNDDCVVIGDENNISKLYDYFEVLNLELSNGVRLDNQTMDVLAKANIVLSDILTQDKDLTLDELMNKYIVRQSNSLARLTFDEVQAIVNKHSSDDQCNIHFHYSSKTSVDWLKKYFNKVHIVQNSSQRVVFIEALGKVDPQYLKTVFSKSKYIIDQSGGLKTLFRYAQENRQLADVSEIFGVSPYMIVQYLLLYDIKGWRNMLKLTSQFSNWEELMSYIIGE